MYWTLIILHLIISVSLITIILIQTGKGASLGAVFGGGASSTLFGAQTPTILTKITITLAVIFVVNSLLLSIIGARQGTASPTPAAPAAAPTGVMMDEEEAAAEQPASRPAPADQGTPLQEGGEPGEAEAPQE